MKKNKDFICYCFIAVAAWSFVVWASTPAFS